MTSVFQSSSRYVNPGYFEAARRPLSSTWFSSEFRCLRPGGVAGLTVGRCDALESGGAAAATAFVFDAGHLIHSSGACVVGRDQLSLSSCVAAAALEVVVVEP